jgi:hypothetical protein
MEFVETPTFTKLVLGLLADDEYAALQWTLAARPELGKIVPGSGGIRKMRWAGSGRGKRGGLRVIYFWFVRENQILMLLAYTKNEKDDLKRDEIKVLKRLIEAHLA